MRRGLAYCLAMATLLFLSAATHSAGAGDPGGVMPLRLPETRDAGAAAMQRELYEAASRLAHHLLASVRPWEKDPSLLLATESRSGEHWIRPNTGIVEGLAFLYRFGTYDEKTVGVGRDRLRETIHGMMRYLVATHVTGTRPTDDGRPWGDAWQSAHWTQALGRAAWWTWDDLPGDLREGVRRVVTHEASRFVDADPPHQIERDTKAEENAWNSAVFSAAMLLVPDSPEYARWEAAFQRWAMSAFLRPADAENEAIVDGRTVAEQFVGANIYDDFTLENHGIVHPDYMTTFSLAAGCATDFRMSGRREPEAVMHNVGGIYENLKWFVLPDGGFVYPSGQDWQLFRNADWLRCHVLMSVLARDPDSWELGRRSLAALEKMQSRSTSGAVYLPEETFFASSHSDLLRSLAGSWLMLSWAEDLPRNFQPRLGVRRLEAAKIVLHRTAAAVNSLSWGNGLMAQSAANALDRIVSPHPRNGVGAIRLAGQNRALPVRVQSVEVREEADGFVAEVVAEHGPGVFRAELRYQSHADGRWSMSERLVAMRDASTAEIATGLIGILNNPQWIYERGYREITLDGETTEVRAQSGAAVTGDGVKEASIDGRLNMQSSEPLAIRYAAARDYERSRVTDELSLNYLGGERSYRAGEEVSRYAVTLTHKPNER